MRRARSTGRQEQRASLAMRARTARSRPTRGAKRRRLSRTRARARDELEVASAEPVQARRGVDIEHRTRARSVDADRDRGGARRSARSTMRVRASTARHPHAAPDACARAPYRPTYQRLLDCRANASRVNTIGYASVNAMRWTRIDRVRRTSSCTSSDYTVPARATVSVTRPWEVLASA